MSFTLPRTLAPLASESSLLVLGPVIALLLGITAAVRCLAAESVLTHSLAISDILCLLLSAIGLPLLGVFGCLYACRAHTPLI